MIVTFVKAAINLKLRNDRGYFSHCCLREMSYRSCQKLEMNEITNSNFMKQVHKIIKACFQKLKILFFAVFS